MKITKEHILKLAVDQLNQNRKEIKHLRKTAKRKGVQRFALAWPHLTSRLKGIENGKIKLTTVGARCVLLENRKPVGSLDSIKQKGKLRLSYISFDKILSKQFSDLCSFIQNKSGPKDLALAEAIEVIPFGTPMIRCKVNGQFKYLRTDAKKPYSFQDEDDAAKYLAGLLNARNSSQIEFKKLKDDSMESRLKALRNKGII